MVNLFVRCSGSNAACWLLHKDDSIVSAFCSCIPLLSSFSCLKSQVMITAHRSGATLSNNLGCNALQWALAPYLQSNTVLSISNEHSHRFVVSRSITLHWSKLFRPMFSRCTWWFETPTRAKVLQETCGESTQAHECTCCIVMLRLSGDTERSTDPWYVLDRAGLFSDCSCICC